MATPRGRESPPVIDRLYEEPRRFSFFQAVRLLERRARRRTAGPRRPVGADYDPREQVVRFCAAVNLSFAANEIEALAAAPGDRPALAISFLGLTGPSGVLPETYSEIVRQTIRDRNFALRDFLDIFNDRLAGLFYAAWAKYRLPVSYERGDTEARQDPITGALYALVGLGTGRLRRRLAIEDEALLHFAGPLARGPRPAAVVEQILSVALGRKVAIDQFRESWSRLPADEQTRLPDRGNPKGVFCRLGTDVVIGERAFDVQGGFRVHVGPLAYREFAAFMPGTADARRLADLVRLLVGPDFDFDVAAHLRAGDVPSLQLATTGDAVPRLGWNTWLASERPRTEDGVMIFQPLQSAL
jgi:type VI secretion system protein ImpH